MVLVSGIICLIVQSFLVLRVWKRESSILRIFSLALPIGVLLFFHRRVTVRLTK